MTTAKRRSIGGVDRARTELVSLYVKLAVGRVASLNNCLTIRFIHPYYFLRKAPPPRTAG